MRIIKDVHDDTKVIDNLGGTFRVAEMLGISRATVYNWKNKGISPGWRKFLQTVHPDAFE